MQHAGTSFQRFSGRKPQKLKIYQKNLNFVSRFLRKKILNLPPKIFDDLFYFSHRPQIYRKPSCLSTFSVFQKSRSQRPNNFTFSPFFANQFFSLEKSRRMKSPKIALFLQFYYNQFFLSKNQRSKCPY